MHYARPGQPLKHLITDLPTGLVGTLTYELYTLDGLAVIAATALDITEPRPGTYAFMGDAPSPATETVYVARFDTHGPGDSTYDEEVTVNATGAPGPIPGPAYATVVDLRNYSDLVTNHSDETLQRALDQATRDVDGKLLPLDLLPSGRKLDPILLTTGEALLLREATMDQALYRLHWGDAFFMMPNQPVTGGEASSSSKIPKFSPVARNKMIEGGMIKMTGRLR